MDNPEKVVQLRHFTLLEFEKNEITSRYYWPELIDRARNFITKWEADTDPVWLFNSLNTAFMIGGGDWLIMAELDQHEEKLCGHMLAQTAPYLNLGYVIMIHQLECDVESSDMLDRGWKRVQQWACEKNIRYVLTFARNQAVARLYRQKYGFKDRRVLQSFDMLKRKD